MGSINRSGTSVKSMLPNQSRRRTKTKLLIASRPCGAGWIVSAFLKRSLRSFERRMLAVLVSGCGTFRLDTASAGRW